MNPMDKEILDELKALRQDLETQTAINVVEGVNTIETLALVGHFMHKQRPPTPKEAVAIERVARRRWSAQVKQAVALARKDPGGLDQSLGDIVASIERKPKPAARGRSQRPKGRVPKRQ